MGRAKLAIAVSCWITGVFVALPGSAQTITPDGTLGTAINQTGLNYTITDGTAAGSNLYHSFKQFSIPTGGSATFDLNATPTIRTLFSRVTGGNISSIDGLIRTTNSANPVSLFLINPAGIVFGANARLNIGGSFVATTAHSVKFADGTEFSAVNPAGTSLLTVSVPIGLQMGPNPGNIQVEGQGHSLLHPPSFLGSVSRDPLLNGLRVQPGKTLALVGNGIQLNGGVLIAESGQVELGSGRAGIVALDTTTPHWAFNYAALPTLADIHLMRASLLDASGNPGGSIHLQGKDLRLQDSSIVLIQQQGGQNLPGRIQVNGDLLELSGALPKKDPSLILSENLGSGQGSTIEVSARQIIARDGGRLITTTFKNGGTGGDITVNAIESIHLIGYSPFDAVVSSGISTPSTTGGGRGGDLAINTSDLLVQGGAVISSSVFGGNGGGALHIQSDQISVIGVNKGNGAGSAISATSFLGGTAKDIDIQTGRLLLRAGGVISTSTSGSSNAGSLTIRASESVEVDGAGSGEAQRSRITASGQAPPGRFQQIFGLPPVPSGNAGNLSIASPSIQVRNQGYIAAENVGSGNAGSLTLTANAIVLDQQGQIRTATTVGQGGNLELTVANLLFLRHNSLITSTAGALGNGGNVIIIAPIVAGFENSDIIANAVQGRGGTIQITTQGIFGLKFRPQLTPTNDITASSQFGVNGTVRVDTISVDPSTGLAELPMNPIDPSQQIAAGCAEGQGSEFVVTGRGGIPENPLREVIHDRPWADVRDPNAFHSPTPPLLHSPPPPLPTPPPLTEATTWQRNPDGEIELIADSPRKLPFSAPRSCARAD